MSGSFGNGGVDTTTETLVRGDDNEELVRSGFVRWDMSKDLCFEKKNSLSHGNGNILENWPLLAWPYSFPARMALCAFASLVEAIIFIDYIRKNTKELVAFFLLNLNVPDLGDFLDVPDWFELQLNLA